MPSHSSPVVKSQQNAEGIKGNSSTPGPWGITVGVGEIGEPAEGLHPEWPGVPQGATD